MLFLYFESSHDFFEQVSEFFGQVSQLFQPILIFSTVLY